MNRRRAADDSDYVPYYGKRKKQDENEELEKKLESLILNVDQSDTTGSLENHLESLASVLESNLNHFRQQVLQILSHCMVKKPEKCTVYTTLVGLLNTKNYNFGGEFIEIAIRQLKELLKGAEWDSARYTLRFLSDLVNCHVVSASSLVHCFQSLMDVVKEDDTPMVRKDWYVFAVLSCLPWVGRELFEKKEQALEKLLTTIEVYLNKRTKKHVNFLKVWTSSPHEQEDYLDCLWAQIQTLKQEYWTEQHIFRPYLAFDNILCEALQHNIPPVLPAPHEPEVRYPLPKIVFRMFDYTDCPEKPTMPGAHSIERFLIEEHLCQIIDAHYKDRKSCVNSLMNVKFKTKVPLEYCVVEVLLGELMRLPAPKYIEILYGSVLVELCKAYSETIPPVLAQAIELFFVRIDSMHVVCFDRFVNWFSYHLSNFKFHYCWEDWESCINFNSEHPQPKCLRELFSKIMRLSYHQRVKEMASPQFLAFLPEKPEPDFKYDAKNPKTADAKAIKISTHLLESFKAKSTSEEILEYLKQFPDFNVDDDNGNRINPSMIDIFVQTLFFYGSKTFSHTITAATKYHEILKVMAENEESQLCILRSVFDLWKNHEQQMLILIDKLIRIQVINCSTVANWIFSNEMSSEFTKMYIWEILTTAVNKVSKYVSRVNRELNELKEKLNPTVQDPDTAAPSIKTEDNANKVTEEMIEQMEDKLETAQSDQKNLFLIIFQRFIMILSEHFAKCDSEGSSFNTYWYRWTIGRLQQIFLTYHEQVEKYGYTLELLLFTLDLDPHILEVFHQFLSLRV